MTWAKDSRNIIEKQGDLELYSDAKATLLFSYIDEQDIEIVSSEQLLGISIKRLVRLAQKKLPSGVENAAVIKSERRWVANNLKDYELLNALTLIYARMYDCCKSLGELVEVPIDKVIPTPSCFESIGEKVRHVSYLKLKNFHSGKIIYSSVSIDKRKIPEKLKERAIALVSKSEVTNIESLVDFYTNIVEETFKESGYHIPILIFFDKKYKVIDLVSTNFDDQADKFIFWRSVASRAKANNAYGFLWISESWLRKSNINSTKAIHEMTITDEHLQIVGINSDNHQKNVTWKILRENQHEKPSLLKIETDYNKEGQAFYMRPILKAIGGDIRNLNG